MAKDYNRYMPDGVTMTDDPYFYGLERIGIGPDASPPLYPLHIQDDTVDMASLYRGMRLAVTKAAGASDQNDPFQGVSLAVSMDQTGGVLGNMAGISLFTELNDGDIGLVGNTRGLWGTYEDVSIYDGTVWGDMYGGYDAVWINAPGTVNGDIFGHYVETFSDGHGGALYGYYLKEFGGEDYGYYQDGSAPNYLGGALEVIGITTATGGISRGAPTELTIAIGVITVTKGYHTVDGEGDLADDLTTINGGVDGETLVIRAEHTDRTITVKDGGNLAIAGDFAMDNTEDTMMLIYDAALTKWLEISRSDNGA